MVVGELRLIITFKFPPDTSAENVSSVEASLRRG